MDLQKRKKLDEETRYTKQKREGLHEIDENKDENMTPLD